MIFLQLFLIFFKIGAFTFGGGYAMLPLIQKEVVSLGWMENETVLNFIAVSESTPGPFAINMATYVGQTMGGTYGLWGNLLGAFCATLGVVLPSFVIILLVARFFEKFKESRIVKGCMTGLKPAVIGLIGSAIVSNGITVFFPTGITLATFATVEFISAAVIFALALVLALKKAHPILIILLSAALGIAVGYLF